MSVVQIKILPRGTCVRGLEVSSPTLPRLTRRHVRTKGVTHAGRAPDTGHRGPKRQVEDVCGKHALSHEVTKTNKLRPRAKCRGHRTEKPSRGNPFYFHDTRVQRTAGYFEPIWYSNGHPPGRSSPPRLRLLFFETEDVTLNLVIHFTHRVS